MTKQQNSITIEAMNGAYEIKCPHCKNTLSKPNADGHLSLVNLKPYKPLSLRKNIINTVYNDLNGIMDKFHLPEVESVFQFDGWLRYGTCENCNQNYYEILLYVVSNAIPGFSIKKCHEAITEEPEILQADMLANVERINESLPYPSQWPIKRYDAITFGDDDLMRLDCHRIGLMPAGDLVEDGDHRIGLSKTEMNQADEIVRELLPGLILHSEHYNMIKSMIDVLVHSKHVMYY